MHHILDETTDAGRHSVVLCGLDDVRFDLLHDGNDLAIDFGLELRYYVITAIHELICLLVLPIADLKEFSALLILTLAACFALLYPLAITSAPSAKPRFNYYNLLGRFWI
jgi:hypothetical protein